MSGYKLPIALLASTVLRPQLRIFASFETAVDHLTTMGFDREDLESAAEILKVELGRVYGTPGRGVINDAVHMWYSGPNDRSVQWAKFKNRLFQDGWELEAIESIDATSSRILGLTVPPEPDNKPISGRGLVLGYVQSGKTTSFMSVISKAVNEGYKLIVVMSGITNNLREQTQVALNSFLAPDDDGDWHWLTDKDHDFQRTGHPNAILTGDKHVILVIKKNGPRLNALYKWLKSASPATRQNCPMLIIDDEADQASVNTAKDVNRRSRINKLILELLNENLMKVSSYIGYTATPFANLLIDPNPYLRTSPDKPVSQRDLFPSDFIVSLPKNNGYFGPEKLFGREPLDEEDLDAGDGIDIVREILEQEILDLGSAVNPATPARPRLTNQLVQALDWFLIATSIRVHRESTLPWSSMLVHTSSRIASHNEMKNLIESQYLQALKNNFENAQPRLLELWTAEANRIESSLDMPTWDKTQEILKEIINKVRVIKDNSASFDRLDYVSGAEKYPVIAIGGNTLSRGLVLRGLVSSYFLRTTNTYDALLQMGRWFGYRKGYEDLQRIWMTKEMATWFRDLALVEMEIRRQIENYESGQIRPDQLPTLIRQHPRMQITNKPGGVVTEVGFSGRRIETIVLNPKDKDWLSSNIDTADSFLATIPATLWKPDALLPTVSVAAEVPVGNVKEFLSKYKFHESAKRILSEPLLKYIDVSNEAGELNTWDIFLFSPSTARPNAVRTFQNGQKITKVVRSKMSSPAETANIHHLANFHDIAIGIPKEFSDKVRALKQNKETSFTKWHDLRDEAGLGKRGLLGLYLVDKDSTPKPGSRGRQPLDTDEDFLGIMIFFPNSQRPNAGITYVGPPPMAPDFDNEFEEEIDEADLADEHEVLSVA